jgi:hypothetical protein
MAVSATWATRYQNDLASIRAKAGDSHAILNRLRPLLTRYHGGAPLGFLAAMIRHESGGKMSSQGDDSLGEVGYFQVTSSFPGKVGVAADVRRTEEGNVFLGCLEYQILDARTAQYGAAPGTADSWKIARLGFAIGEGGTRTLLKRAGSTRYEDLIRVVDETGGIPLGSQEAGKVWYRVRAVELLWWEGQLVDPAFWYGEPRRIPAPSGITYRFPQDVAPYFNGGIARLAIGFGLAGAALFL